MMTKEERLAYQRERRKQNGNADIKKYEKTEKGFLMRLYRNMKSRITGVQKQKHHLYEGKTLLSKGEFFDWATSQPEFYNLFTRWVEASYDRKLTPSVDRKDSTKGYEQDNMEWVTHSENSKRGAISRHYNENPAT